MLSISAVMPAYNEEDNVGPIVEAMVATIAPLTDDYEIIVVDDGSRDGTAQKVKEAAQKYPQARLVQHEINQGYGAAVFTAFTSSTRDLIFFTDADRQFDLNEIHKLLPLIGEADLAVGYRSPRRDPFMRKLNGWGWSVLATLLFGYTARDVDCAFKLFRREIIDEIGDQIVSRGATFSAEFLVRAKRAGLTIREVPLAGHRPRVAGSQTGARLDVILRAFRELIRFRLQLWAEQAP
ncbi:MAG: glycosyltransferase family 2 protein [Anaerolineae bacterium]|nr:glycosyltransferase family 2 protein [Anaerolineae bacterium]